MFIGVMFGCANYKVDVSSSKQYSPLINRYYLSTMRLMVYQSNEVGHQQIKVGPQVNTVGVTCLGWIEADSTIILRKVVRRRISYFEDLDYPVVEINFQGKPLFAEAFILFLVDGEFAPNPRWLIPSN